MSQVGFNTEQQASNILYNQMTVAEALDILFAHHPEPEFVQIDVYNDGMDSTLYRVITQPDGSSEARNISTDEVYDISAGIPTSWTIVSSTSEQV